MKRIPSLDGFRCISIILVLITHFGLSVGFPTQFAELAKFGSVGVTFFFVISGFLITTLLLREEEKTGKINLKDFYKRRAFRILPVLLLYILFISLWRNVENIELANTDIIRALIFMVNFSQKPVSWFLIHFWTLSVEEQFYIFFPLILILFRKKLKTTLVIFIIYSCLSRAIAFKYPDYKTIVLSQYFSYSDAIMIGALGAVLLYERPLFINLKIFRYYSLQFIALILIGLFLYLPTKGLLAIIALPFGNSIISICALFLIVSYIRPSESVVFKILNSKVVVHIGVLSYSIYVWQQFFIKGELHVVWRIFPYNLVFIYLVSLASYYLWEQAFLRIRKTYFPQRSVN